ncbi:hypothetical protein NMY22_g1625 [Coprinellus aureogranulatus]|nr:hypothetical protein NMY22_g1625 [Coprinellus aureogranulatus]
MEVTSASRLLPEILGEVFGWAVAEPDHDTLSGRDRKQLIDLLLVCKEWCDAALETHYLWNRVNISIQDQFPASQLLAWFEKAGSAPKTLEIWIMIFFSDNCQHYASSDGACHFRHLVNFLKVGPPLDSLILWECPEACFRVFMREMQDQSPSAWNSIRRLNFSMPRWPDISYEPPCSLPLLPPSLTSIRLTVVSLGGQAQPSYGIPPVTNFAIYLSLW